MRAIEPGVVRNQHIVRVEVAGEKVQDDVQYKQYIDHCIQRGQHRILCDDTSAQYCFVIEKISVCNCNLEKERPTMPFVLLQTDKTTKPRLLRQQGFERGFRGVVRG